VHGARKDAVDGQQARPLSSSYFTFEPFGISVTARKYSSIRSLRSTSCHGCIGSLRVMQIASSRPHGIAPSRAPG
jgi:hypothetical protein